MIIRRPFRVALVARSVLALAVSLGALRAFAQDSDDGAAFEFTGTQRARYESLDGQFLPGLDAGDHVLALQTSLLFERRVGSVTLIGEILDSRAEWNDAGSFLNNTVVNSLEPLQAHVAWTWTNAERPGTESSLRVGRMTLDLGKRRVLSRNRFRNTVNNFLGADWQWRGADGRNLRAFRLVPMRQLPTDAVRLLGNEAELDRASRDTSLTGVYYQLPVLTGRNVIETYVLDYQSESADAANTADLLTLGARAYRSPSKGTWHYEIEGIAQVGESGATVAGVARANLRHSARFVHLELGYAFDARWSPDLMLQYDRASGDDDPLDERNERFNTLFGDRRFDFGPTGIYGPFQRANLETPGLRLTVNPTPRWQGMLSYRSLRVASSTDTWVGVGVRDANGEAGRSLGRQLEGSAVWTAIPGRLSLDFGFAALTLGRFARETLGVNAHGNPTYYYAAVTTSF